VFEGSVSLEGGQVRRWSKGDRSQVKTQECAARALKAAIKEIRGVIQN
jgi:hypothetical protein